VRVSRLTNLRRRSMSRDAAGARSCTLASINLLSHIASYDCSNARASCCATTRKYVVGSRSCSTSQRYQRLNAIECLCSSHAEHRHSRPRRRHSPSRLLPRLVCNCIMYAMPPTSCRFSNRTRDQELGMSRSMAVASALSNADRI